MSANGAADDRSRGALATAAALVVFGALAAAGLAHHEMWRDELEIWLIARDSASLPQLFRHMATEGHPALWYVLNWLLARVTTDPAAMQALNLLVGLGTVGVFFRYAPFGLATRVLFSVGYYPLYEFGVISRSYGLALLLLFAACARLALRRRLDLPAAILLALLAQTHLFGTLFAFCILIQEFLRARGGEGGARVAPAPFALVAVTATAGFLHTLAQSLAIGPDHAGAYRPEWDARWFADGLGSVARGFLPMPDLTTFHTWNSSFLDPLGAPFAAGVSALLAVALLAGCVWALRGRPALLAGWALGSTALLTLTLFVWHGYQRHHGQQFLWFLACLWLARALTPPVRTDGSAIPAPRFVPQALVALLVIHALAGAVSYVRDLALPFSNARAVGRYLQSEAALREALLAGSIDYAAQPVAAYTDRPIYYPDSRRFGTFLDWGPTRSIADNEDVLRQCAALARSSGRDVILLLNRSPAAALRMGDSFQLDHDIVATLFAKFDGALVRDENYWLYRIRSAQPR